MPPRRHDHHKKGRKKEKLFSERLLNEEKAKMTEGQKNCRMLRANAEYSPSRYRCTDGISPRDQGMASHRESGQSGQPRAGCSQRGKKYPGRGRWKQDDFKMNNNSFRNSHRDRGPSQRLQANNRTSRNPAATISSDRYSSNSPTTSSRRRIVDHSATATTDRDSSSIEIPGFYYDKVKKKYFRIVPGQNNQMSGAITTTAVKVKCAEEKRQAHLRRFDDKEHGPRLEEISRTYRTRCVASKNIYDIIERVRLGNVTRHCFRNSIRKSIVSNLKPRGKMPVYDSPGSSYDKLEHMTRMVASDDGTKFLCLWALQDLLVQRIQVLSVNSICKTECQSSSGFVKMDVKPTGATILQSFTKVTHICWAPASQSDNSNQFILYTTMGFIGNTPSLALLRNMDPTGPVNFRYTEFNMGKTAIWTCAWDRHNAKFSAGTEKSGLVIDVHTRRMWELFTNKSDVLAQQFSSQGCNLLYSGTRKGELCGHDLRSWSTHPVVTMKQATSIGHLHLTGDDNYLIASDFGGNIKKWDIRARAVVQTYDGHYNEYIQIPFHVDEERQLLYSGVFISGLKEYSALTGQDCYTRFWCLTSGTLLQTLPSPYPATRDMIPSVYYSETVGTRQSQPGLLMGIKDEIHFYSR